MRNPIPLAVYWLLLTCWSCTSANTVTTRVVGVGDARLKHDSIRRIDPISELGDWKPIDYGHPMRDDPTLVYVPPVVDPVHYGIHSAEPLWPIRGPKLPQFHLPPEAMLASSSTDQRWRSRQTLRPKQTDVTTPRTTFQPSQRTRRPADNRLTQFHRHPVRSTAWKRNDHISNQLIGRSPALGPPLPVVLPTFRPGVMPTLKPVVLPMSRPSRPRITPMSRSEHHMNNQRIVGRQNPSPDLSSSHRYFSSSARSYDNAIDSSDNSNGISSSKRNSHHGSILLGDSIDRADDSDGLLVTDVSSEQLQNEKKDVGEPDHHQRKRAKKPFFPFQFVIQSGYSKVRKYGNDIKEFIR